MLHISICPSSWYCSTICNASRIKCCMHRTGYGSKCSFLYTHVLHRGGHLSLIALLLSSVKQLFRPEITFSRCVMRNPLYLAFIYARNAAMIGTNTNTPPKQTPSKMPLRINFSLHHAIAHHGALKSLRFISAPPGDNTSNTVSVRPTCLRPLPTACLS